MCGSRSKQVGWSLLAAACRNRDDGAPSERPADTYEDWRLGSHVLRGDMGAVVVVVALVGSNEGRRVIKRHAVRVLLSSEPRQKAGESEGNKDVAKQQQQVSHSQRLAISFLPATTASETSRTPEGCGGRAASLVACVWPGFERRDVSPSDFSPANTTVACSATRRALRLVNSSASGETLLYRCERKNSQGEDEETRNSSQWLARWLAQSKDSR